MSAQMALTMAATEAAAFRASTSRQTLPSRACLGGLAKALFAGKRAQARGADWAPCSRRGLFSTLLAMARKRTNHEEEFINAMCVVVRDCVKPQKWGWFKKQMERALG